LLCCDWLPTAAASWDQRRVGVEEWETWGRVPASWRVGGPVPSS
jgi:hypothetical protein